jgi:hypothetical protein
MYGTGGAGQVVNPVNVQHEGFRYIVTQEMKSGMPRKPFDIGLASGMQIVRASNVMPLRYECPAKMGADESRAAGYKNFHALFISCH